MLKGVNDSPAEAKALVQLLKGIPAKINLIPFNPWPGSPYECSDWGTIEAFAAILNRGGYASPIRHAPRPRHPRRLRPAEERKREGPRQRPAARRRLSPNSIPIVIPGLVPGIHTRRSRQAITDVRGYGCRYKTGHDERLLGSRGVYREARSSEYRYP